MTPKLKGEAKTRARKAKVDARAQYVTNLENLCMPHVIRALLADQNNTVMNKEINKQLGFILTGSELLPFMRTIADCMPGSNRWQLHPFLRHLRIDNLTDEEVMCKVRKAIAAIKQVNASVQVKGKQPQKPIQTQEEKKQLDLAIADLVDDAMERAKPTNAFVVYPSSTTSLPTFFNSKPSPSNRFRTTQGLNWTQKHSSKSSLSTPFTFGQIATATDSKPSPWHQKPSPDQAVASRSRLQATISSAPVDTVNGQVMPLEEKILKVDLDSESALTPVVLRTKTTQSTDFQVTVDLKKVA